MKTTRIATRTSILAAVASIATLTGCTTYEVHNSPPPVVYTEPAPPPPPQVEPATTVEVIIHEERDFYEPLTPYGHWEYIGGYGRCWVPARVDRSWRPYTYGHWERTDAGWYWVSDEPWGWATYHYGRWDYDIHFGWFWVPQTMWAPAWVTWNRGGGYIGWAPLPPSVRTPRSGVLEVNTRVVPQRGYVFVEERRFLEPVRPTTIVNNTTIINKTVNITNVKVVNNTVINEGPRTQDIEQASGHKIRQVTARELRHKIEAPVAATNQPHGNARDVSRTPAQTKAPATTPTPATPAPTPSDAGRQAAERGRQEKMDADRKAQADAERARQAAIEKAKQEREQQRKAEAEAARKKQEADARAREQAARDAQQKQRQLEEARRKQELDRKAQTQAAEQARPPQADEKPRHPQQAGKKVQPSTQSQNGADATNVHGKGLEKKNPAESERRDHQQQKGQGKNKKAPQTQSAPASTNATGSQPSSNP